MSYCKRPMISHALLACVFPAAGPTDFNYLGWARLKKRLGELDWSRSSLDVKDFVLLCRTVIVCRVLSPCLC